ncbi:MAG: demethylmenaquinone methyltransferase / 2-methoxy-6-polyprenyl,4-benzoquinol methylase [Acidobacteriota bacterium]|nr:demethylmenaquinone methyltransferase / 2-methoxy-6-polyprenyl,4-benzoquinol methylase [Acidobacteriota bacterium]
MPETGSEVLAQVTAVEQLKQKDAARIRAMFGRVARRYDLLNHLLSASLDRVWRRKLAQALVLPPGSRVLDLCCGTGDQALALRRPGIEIVAADFCLPMLALAAPKFQAASRSGAGASGASGATGASGASGASGGRNGLPQPAVLNADALHLPFPDASFHAATVSFGLRNVADLDRALAELARVLRPGCELGVLEFTVPSWQPLRGLYLFYFQHLLPKVGSLLSKDPTAYTYLPSSVLDFPQREAFTARLEAAGFASATSTSLSGGILALYRGRKKMR